MQVSVSRLVPDPGVAVVLVPRMFTGDQCEQGLAERALDRLRLVSALCLVRRRCERRPTSCSAVAPYPRSPASSASPAPKPVTASAKPANAISSDPQNKDEPVQAWGLALRKSAGDPQSLRPARRAARDPRGLLLSIKTSGATGSPTETASQALFRTAKTAIPRGPKTQRTIAHTIAHCPNLDRIWPHTPRFQPLPRLVSTTVTRR